MAIEPRTAALFARLYAEARSFEPTAYFDPEMDQLVYTTSNDSYRADRVDARLTILWDTHELKIIGIKLKGFRSLFEQMKATGLVEESHFLPLCKVISLLLQNIVRSANGKDSDADFRERAKWYQKAEEFVGNYRFDERQLLAA